MVNDKTGRKLKEGQTVDVMMLGLFQGQVVKIVENPIEVPGAGQIPPHIVIQMVITPAVRNGYVPDVFILKDVQETSLKGIIEGDERFTKH